jgi:hypothetical protein
MAVAGAFLGMILGAGAKACASIGVVRICVHPKGAQAQIAVTALIPQVEPVVVESRPVRSIGSAGLQLEHRARALAMLDSGEAPARIAASLDAPRGEVELLMKIHRLVRLPS